MVTSGGARYHLHFRQHRMIFLGKAPDVRMVIKTKKKGKKWGVRPTS